MSKFNGALPDLDSRRDTPEDHRLTPGPESPGLRGDPLSGAQIDAQIRRFFGAGSGSTYGAGSSDAVSTACGNAFSRSIGIGSPLTSENP